MLKDHRASRGSISSAIQKRPRRITPCARSCRDRPAADSKRDGQIIHVVRLFRPITSSVAATSSALNVTACASRQWQIGGAYRSRS